MEWKEFELYRSCDRTNLVFSLLLPLFLSNLLLEYLSLSMCLSVCLFPNRKLEYALIALDCHTIHGLVKCDLMPSMNSKMFTIQNQFHAFILHLHCPQTNIRIEMVEWWQAKRKWHTIKLCLLLLHKCDLWRCVFSPSIKLKFMQMPMLQ